jgi:WD40 repeat protein
MKFLRFLVPLVLCTHWALIAVAAGPELKPAIPSYLITNDDLPPKIAFGATFFTFAADGTPRNPNKVNLGGVGAGGGYFGFNRVSVLQGDSAACAYLSLGGSGEIGAVDIQALQDIGNFPAASTDTGIDNGIGLANNGIFLYAAFSTSNTLGTFAILPGCSLNFLGDISPLGKHEGNVKGMAVHGNLLIVAYGDGSIESFNVSAGIPVSNGDLQNATGFNTDRFPTGVDITQDGHFAIFGDQSSSTTVEVSDISSGKLTKTMLYNLGNAQNSNNVFLSPDQSLIYIANTGSGKVSAAFFNKTTGKVSQGCISAQLKGFDSDWVFLSSPVTQRNTGTGSVVYLAEFGAFSGIAVLDVTQSGGKCTLTETSSSPVIDPNSTTLLSIGIYPPRKF